MRQRRDPNAARMNARRLWIKPMKHRIFIINRINVQGQENNTLQQATASSRTSTVSASPRRPRLPKPRQIKPARRRQRHKSDAEPPEPTISPQSVRIAASEPNPKRIAQAHNPSIRNLPACRCFSQAQRKISPAPSRVRKPSEQEPQGAHQI